MDRGRPISPAYDYVPEPGDEFDGYRIVEHVADGGWGSVYKAIRTTSHEYFALKTIRQEIAGERRYRDLFEREQTALKKLRSHPNLCPAVDWSHDPTRPDRLLWLAMPWIDGSSLSDLIQEDGPLWPSRAAALIAEAADGLHAVHTAKEGMAHRDLRPANLMIDEDQHLVVIDFGLAKRFEYSSDSPLMPNPGPWSSPEVLEATELTPRSDIYSLGLILAFVLTGARPVDQAPVYPPQIDLPRSLRSVIERATSPAAADRYETVAEFAAALRETATEKPRRPPVSRGRVAAVTIVAAVIAFLGVAFFPDGSSEVGPEISVAQANVDVPAGWRAVRVPAADRRLGMSRAMRGPDSLVLLGTVPPPELPAPAAGVQAYDVLLPSGRAVRADQVESLRATRLFVLRLDTRYLLIVCRPLAGGEARVARQSCDTIAARVELASQAEAIPYPSVEVQRQAAAALHGYAKARRRTTDAIEAAADPAEAAAAMRVAAAAARKSAKGLDEAGLAHLRRSLQRAADAWHVAARAAQKRNRDAYSRAGKRVKKVESRIREARRRLAALGYRSDD